jgi:hypothetical protein
MPIVRIVHRSRKLLVLGLIGAVTFIGGCDSGGNVGESTVAPATPPPGKSGADMKNAMEKAGLSPGGVPAQATKKGP